MLQINALPKMHVNTLCNAPVEPGDRALQRTSLHCHTLVHASFALLRMNLTIKLLNNLFSKAKRKREKSSKKKSGGQLRTAQSQSRNPSRRGGDSNPHVFPNSRTLRCKDIAQPSWVALTAELHLLEDAKKVSCFGMTV